MSNWMRDWMTDLFRQTQGISLVRLAIATLLITIYGVVMVVLAIMVILQSLHKPIDGVFVGIVTGGVFVMVLLIALFVAISTWHWVDPHRKR